MWKGPQSKQLVLVKPFIFFKNCKEVNNSPGMMTTGANNVRPALEDEGADNADIKTNNDLKSNVTVNEEDGQLLRCLEVIKEIHTKRFSEVDTVGSVGTTNVVDSFVSYKSEVLRNYGIAFSGVIPHSPNHSIEYHPFYISAKSMGASICTDRVISSSSRVTHLVTAPSHINSPKVRSCIESRNDVWIVSIDWLQECRWKLKKMDEIPYLLHLAPEIPPAPLPHITTDNIKLESGKEEALIQETLSDENPSKKMRSDSPDSDIDMTEDHLSCDTAGGSNSESSDDDDEEWLKAIEKGEQ